MINVVENNPYRILGVYANSPKKDINMETGDQESQFFLYGHEKQININRLLFFSLSDFY